LKNEACDFTAAAKYMDFPATSVFNHYRHQKSSFWFYPRALSSFHGSQKKFTD
jgi:hypothetical protein